MTTHAEHAAYARQQAENDRDHATRLLTMRTSQADQLTDAQVAALVAGAAALDYRADAYFRRARRYERLTELATADKAP